MRAHALLVVIVLGCGGSPSDDRPQPLANPPGPAPAACPGVSSDEATRMQAVLRDPQDRFRGAYPVAPALTCPILQGLAAELAHPEIRARYESMSADRWTQHHLWAETITSLGRSSQRYTLIALSTHWSTDHKILALRAFQRIPSRLLINTTADGQAKLLEIEQAALRFLIRVVESTPRVIAGSENSTIHGIYMDELIRTLDMLSGERDKRGAVRTKAMTEAEFTEALAGWKRKLVP